MEVIAFFITLILVLFVIGAMFLVPKTKSEHEQKPNIDYKQLGIDEVLHQATLVGDNKTIEEIKNGTYQGRTPFRYGVLWDSMYPDDLMITSIAGINHRKNIKYYTGEFEGMITPEPTNTYDKDAIMIKALDQHHLGYVPKNETQFVRNMIGKDFNYHYITGFIDEYDDGDHKYYAGCIYIVK